MTVENLIDQTAPTPIDGLALALENCKAQITALEKNKSILEKALAEAVGVKGEGSHTKATDFFKVTTTGKINRTLDAVKVEALRGVIPPEAFESLFSFRPSLNIKAYRDVVELHPDVAAVIDSAITSKPGKPTIKVARV